MRPNSMHPLTAIAFAISCALVSPKVLAQSSASSQGHETTPTYSIPAQSLSDAVLAFARQSRLQVVFSPDALVGLRSNPLVGTFSSDAALQQLLANSGAAARKGKRGVWIIEPQRDRSVQAARAPRSPTRKPAEAAADAKPKEDDSSDYLETIVVTGSNIEKLGPIGSTLHVLTEEDIRRSGASSLEQVMHQLPQVYRGGDAGALADVTMSLGSQRAYNMTAGSGVNLRGLGANSTLVLVNGRRVAASSGGTYTDISTIPIDAIERIEVLPDGASAVYGADAVGGVVNIILKSGYDSAQSKVSYGRTTTSGREEFRISHTMGRQFERGGFTATIDHLDQSQLDTTERSFTRNVAGPTTVLPENVMDSLAVNGDLFFTDNLSIRADGQYSRSQRKLVTVDYASVVNKNDITPVRSSFGLSIDYRPSDDWWGSIDIGSSREDAKNDLISWNGDGTLGYSYVHQRIQTQRGAGAKLNGTIATLPGGDVRMAVGAGYKQESYRRTIDLYALEQGVERHSKFAFAEAYFPLFSNANSRPGLHGLDLAIAFRHDDYSDFGPSTNPRFGVNWSPTDRLSVRASYSTSFRAPSIGEEARTSEDGLIGMELFALPVDDSGSAWVPVLSLLGSNQLEPETSKNLSVGIEWRPTFADGLTVGANYYSIQYKDRITLPPLEVGVLYEPQFAPFLQHFSDSAQVRALVDAAIARGLPFLDLTEGEFGDDPLVSTFAVYSYLWTNAARVDMSGVDLTVRYAVPLDDQLLEFALDASYVHEFRTRIAAGTPYFNSVGTYGQPPRLKAKGSVAWASDRLSASFSANYVGSYSDTTALHDRRVRPYTTVDFVARYAFHDPGTPGFSVAVNALNLFDERPPHIQASGRGSHYDPGNASPLGRMITLQITKSW